MLRLGVGIVVPVLVMPVGYWVLLGPRRRLLGRGVLLGWVLRVVLIMRLLRLRVLRSLEILIELAE